ncbi:MAG: hypothetical protein A2V52_07180 [Actinobacteria bacterium RBG_19FT_COMBO_54_7]|uniref:Signal peptidase I n=1 Tax=Candidatus Solincola sediminis TaxID=1797199 RepID=A0A1F2WJD5_9ACTN|nr:MAG: hypothetical protein A2Y75_07215 [Candidatus Solincola sediminis]OFW59644.1 MAG: hypothetical protein A2W01_01060 [Candidatus Solincola sediminis]OFW70281.1 MAG: hypothetical protein A2V52_07180 [Actinobacteria bacterium RBG_19FT_COMBO_54_7]
MSVLLAAAPSVPVANLPIIPIIIGSVLFTWLFTGWLMYRIGRKLGYERPWYAWLPFLFLYMMVELSNRDKDWFWIIAILAFIPCANLIAAIMFFIVIMDLSEKCGKPRWWGLLWLIPVGVWVVMYITGSGEAAPEVPSEF